MSVGAIRGLEYFVGDLSEDIQNEDGLDTLPGIVSRAEGKTKPLSEKRVKHLVFSENLSLEKLPSCSSISGSHKLLRKTGHKVALAACATIEEVEKFSATCPLFNPPRADTRVYSEDSEELARKAKAISKITALENSGASFNLPLDIILGESLVPGASTFLSERNQLPSSLYLFQPPLPEPQQAAAQACGNSGADDGLPPILEGGWTAAPIN